ncbi:cAMP-dependent protein kinase catalytic subunit PRKX [Dictyocoela muelleri]|nr:cAMP-dependent protein kinase catalytic subunit PRKX [Dictyocoela muelleri]
MFHKEDLNVVQKIFSKNFHENYIVYFSGLKIKKPIGKNNKNKSTNDENKSTNNKNKSKNGDTKENVVIRKYFECRAANKQAIVIKREENLLKEELKVRNNIRCNFLVNVISTFQDVTFLYYITELPKGGFLYFYLQKHGRFDLELSKFLFAEMLLAIQYLHARNLVYRLLIPENIMITFDGHVKLKFDFLNSNGLTEKQFQKLIEYIPIDYLKNNESTFASDYWSLGIILFEMIDGVSPFKGTNFEHTKFNILNNNPVFENNFDQKSKDLVEKLLIKNKIERLGFFKNDRFLIRKHPFLANINFHMLAENKIRSPLDVVVDNLFNKESNIKLSDIYKKSVKYVSSDGYGDIFKFYGTNSDLFNKRGACFGV